MIFDQIEFDLLILPQKALKVFIKVHNLKKAVNLPETELIYIYIYI